MAESARSVAVKFGTNLHAAFDTELGRVHTIWRGGPLNLWGPPYSHTKSPFISDFEGQRVYTFPKFSPWFAGGKQLAVHFRGISTANGAVMFEYRLRGEKIDTLVRERIAGAADGETWAVTRRFEFPGGSKEDLRYVLFAEGGAVTDGFRDGKWRGTNGTLHFKASGAAIEWSLVREQVDYSSEIITDAGTEKGNPVVRYSGEEARAYLAIPKRGDDFCFPGDDWV